MERGNAGYIPILLCGPCAVRILDPRYGIARRNAAVWRSSVSLAPGLAAFVLVAGYALSFPAAWVRGIAVGLVAAWAAARLWYAYATKGMPRG